MFSIYSPRIRYGHTSIVLYDSATRGISCGKGLPWKIPEDMEYFLSFVKDDSYIPICGKNTYNDLPSSIKGSFIVVGSDTDFKCLDDAINYAEALGKYALVCGGQRLYEEAIINKRVNVFVENQISGFNDLDYTKFYPVHPECECYEIIHESFYINKEAGYILTNLVIERF